MIMLTRFSERIFNPIRYTFKEGNKVFIIIYKNDFDILVGCRVVRLLNVQGFEWLGHFILFVSLECADTLVQLRNGAHQNLDFFMDRELTEEVALSNTRYLWNKDMDYAGRFKCCCASSTGTVLQGCNPAVHFRD